MRVARVLLSARDPGGAAQVRAVAPALRGDRRLQVSVAASGAGGEILEAAGERPIRFALPDGSTHVPSGTDPAPFLAAADALLTRLDPDALVVGISSLGVGLDEALLARAAGRPTFALQDYPGDANSIGGAYAGLYFVRDETAARLTRARFGVETLPVGSLRHAAYARLDVPALRETTRARIHAMGDRPVVGFFGQPAEIPGHEAAFEHLARALGELEPRPLAILREHPKSLGRRGAHLATLEGRGVTVYDASEDGGVEPWLAASDVVATCFSHCTMDHAFLSGRSPEPLGAALFLLTTPEAWTFMREYTGLTVPDGVERGLGRVAESPERVRPLLGELLSPEGRRDYHAASRTLPREVALDRIVAAVAEAGLSRAAAR